MNAATPSHRLEAYTKLAIGAGMTAASPASAAIVFFDVSPAATISANGSSGSSYVTFGDINLATGTYTLGAQSGLHTTFVFTGGNYWGTLGNLQFATTPPAAYAAFLNYGDIHFSPPFYSWASGVTGQGAWASGGTGYVGLLLAVGGFDTWNFGWMALSSVVAGDSSTLTISGFAFETVGGQPIAAGAGGPGPAPVPEPGTWAAAALLVGGAAFLRWRKRRDAAQKEAA